MFNTGVTGVSFPHRRATRTGLRVTSDERRATIRRVFVTILYYFCGVFLSLVPAMGAEDVTVTTYYPSPRGVYDELRTTGDVGVGVTGPVLGKLHVVQTAIAPAFRVEDEATATEVTPFLIDFDGNVGAGTGAPGAKLHVVQDNAANAFRVDDEVPPDTTPFLIDQNGSVGIQTIPTTTLEIVDNDASGDSVVKIVSDDTVSAFLQFVYDDAVDRDWRFYINVDGKLYVADQTDGLNVMIFNNNGRVGIGTDTPAAGLEVQPFVGVTGVKGEGDGAVGVHGVSNNNVGVLGQSATGTGIGVSGSCPGCLGVKGQGATGVVGESTNVGGFGVSGQVADGIGVQGIVTDGTGVVGTSTNGVGVMATGGIGFGDAGLIAEGTDGVIATAKAVGGAGIHALDDGDPARLAGRFDGEVEVNGLLDVNGNIEVSGSITGGDVAEFMDCVGCKPTDVVVIDTEHNRYVKPSSRPYDSTVAGVVSEKPSLKIGGSDSEIAKPLALAGLVRVKATTENGPIKRGDLLVTSSKPGHAMRADPERIKPGMLLGKALEPLEEGDGTILLLVE